MYQSISNIGGTRFKPVDKYVDLLDFGPKAPAVIFNDNSIVTSIKESCPTHTSPQEHLR